MAEEWQSQKFRQNVITKMCVKENQTQSKLYKFQRNFIYNFSNEILQSTRQDGKSASVMESHIFKKSKNKDEYLGLVAKLFMHFKDLSQSKSQGRLGFLLRMTFSLFHRKTSAGTSAKC